MPNTKCYARGRVWQNEERIAMTLRAPVKLHKRLVRMALKNKMTLNDLMLSLMADATNPKR